MDIKFLLDRIARLSALTVCRSQPMIRGALAKAQRAKCVFSSSAVSRPFPTYSMSGSFQCPGEAELALIMLIRKFDLTFCHWFVVLA